MGKEKQEFFAFGELAAFFLAWVLGIFAALGEYNGRTNHGAGDNLAATGSPTSNFEVLD